MQIHKHTIIVEQKMCVRRQNMHNINHLCDEDEWWWKIHIHTHTRQCLTYATIFVCMYIFIQYFCHVRRLTTMTNRLETTFRNCFFSPSLQFSVSCAHFNCMGCRRRTVSFCCTQVKMMSNGITCTADFDFEMERRTNRFRSTIGVIEELVWLSRRTLFGRVEGLFYARSKNFACWLISIFE